jgi:hypothetical protein
MRWTLMGSSRRKSSILAFSASRLLAHSSSLDAFSAEPDLATAALSESVAVLAAIARILWWWSSAPPLPSLLTVDDGTIAAGDPEIPGLHGSAKRRLQMEMVVPSACSCSCVRLYGTEEETVQVQVRWTWRAGWSFGRWKEQHRIVHGRY